MSPSTGPERVRCFLDITVGSLPAGRLVVELRSDIVPRTAENFRVLCTGELGKDTHGNILHYKGSCFHRHVEQFIIQGGDFTHGNGQGGVSVYGKKFADENFKLSHDQRGVISMANNGPNTNGSQFFFTLTKTAWLDGKHVAFGKVVEGHDVLDRMEETPTLRSHVPHVPVVITNCGQL